MILVDANLLIYAVNKNSPQHKAARKWLELTLSGSEAVGLPWIVVLAFLRITTRAGILEHPLTGDQALEYVDQWLALPVVSLVAPGERNWPVFWMTLKNAGWQQQKSRPVPRNNHGLCGNTSCAGGPC